MSKRRYTQKKRAQQQSVTRDRIVQATMALHEELGPRDTTVSAIAERAGVQRLTVYRHFPDERTLFEACTTRWLELNPPPAAAAWRGIEDPLDRARAALQAFYAYYRSGERMWGRAYRDRDEVPALQGPMAAFDDALHALRDELAAGWKLPNRARQPLQSTLDLALRFHTWRSFNDMQLSDKAMADLVGDWLSCLASAPQARQTP